MHCIGCMRLDIFWKWAVPFQRWDPLSCILSQLLRFVNSPMYYGVPCQNPTSIFVIYGGSFSERKAAFQLPSPMPELSRTPHANQIALVKLSDSSFWLTFTDKCLPELVCWAELPSLAASNLPKGENLSSKYKQRATTWTDTKTSTHSVDLKGCKNDTNWEARGC